MALEELSFESVNGLADARMDNRQKVIPIVHPEHISGELKKPYLYVTCRLVLFFITTKYHQNIPKNV